MSPPTHRPNHYLASLLRELCALPRETEWLEFKRNEAEPQAIGEYISALANAAALAAKAFAYVVWGVCDSDHSVVGTDFDPRSVRVGNEELESWLCHLLEPRIGFHFFTTEIDGRRVVLLEVARAMRQPVRFSGQEFIRLGSYKKKLKDFPEKERALWRIFDQVSFEEGIAEEGVTAEEILQLLDYPSYFDLCDQPLPVDRDGILEAMAADRLIHPDGGGAWNVSNLGAALFAKRLSDFKYLKRKALRIIQYRGKARLETWREHEVVSGYATGFEGMIAYIMNLVPSEEVIGQALRKSTTMFPELAVRELVANALIHQDFSITGAGPMVELFDDRIEITNPGEPLVDTQRFVDTPPKSRNETLASIMRRCNICEERGSGIDKVVSQIEMCQLPAPVFESPKGFTRTVLFAHRPLSEMDKQDRIRSCYLHACLKYVTRQAMTNKSLRQRFGIDAKNASIASRLLNEAVQAGLLVLVNPRVGTRIRSYQPFWAQPGP